MPTRLLALTFGVVIATSGAAISHTDREPRQAASSTREQDWRADFDYFAREFATAQLDFHKLYPRFDRDLAGIASYVAASTDTDIVLDLMKLVASARVGHTNVRVPSRAPAFHRLPLSLAWFADGLAVMGASEPYRAALGLRVISIGRLAPEQLEATVEPYIAHENDPWLHQQSPSFMVMHELLRRADVVESDGRVTMTLAQTDGSTMSLRIGPEPWQGGPPLVSAIDSAHTPITIARKELDRYYRYEILPPANALYVRYSRCRDDPKQPFAAFAREVFAAVDAASPAITRFVIDLRANGGGDSRILTPLLDGLKAKPALKARGHLYALVDAGTFSSGLLAAIVLKQDLKAILVGEAPGEKPNSYGEVRQLTLPHSRLVIQYSTKFFRMTGSSDRPTYEPDVVVRRSIADALAGRDPVLDAALRVSGR
jgi:hypothetical protein